MKTTRRDPIEGPFNDDSAEPRPAPVPFWRRYPEPIPLYSFHKDPR